VAVYFHNAGQLVLDGRDPLTVLPRFQWNFLPFMPYLFALEIRTGLPWELASKIAPIAADLVITALLGRLGPASLARSAPLLYALCPVAILVSAQHGQVEPVALALGIGALLLARRGAVARSGLLAGLAVATKTWPVLLVVGMLRATPVRRWWRLVVPLLAVLAALLLSIRLFLDDSVHHAVRVLASYRSLTGGWGWTGILNFFHVVNAGYQGPKVDPAQRIGTVLLAIAMIVIIVLFWRTGPVALTAAMLLTFLVVSAGFGVQYLLWPVPFVIALRRVSGLIFTLLAGLYAIFVYAVVLAYPAHIALSTEIQQWASLPVIASALLAIPWSSRRTDTDAGQSADSAANDQNALTQSQPKPDPSLSRA
jgi:hypothetical protein